MSDDLRYMRLEDVVHTTGVGKSTLFNLIKRGEFPAPIRVLPNTSRWLSDEVQEWIKQTSRRARFVGLGKSDQRTTGAS